MTMFQVWRRMMKKPLPRVLFGYIYGSSALMLLVWFFAPIQMVWKQLIALLLASPYLIGIPLIELCLLIRERRLNWYLKGLKKILPMFVFFTLVNLLAGPNFFWQIFLGSIVTMLISTLFGSWGGRMIELGYFGDSTESESKPD